MPVYRLLARAARIRLGLKPYAEAILGEMDLEDAREARQFLEYPSDSAGGIMVSEFLAYPWDMRRKRGWG